MIWIILAIIIYLAGAWFAWGKIKNWEHPVWEKVAFTGIWPLVGILYGIHWLHNQ